MSAAILVKLTRNKNSLTRIHPLTELFYLATLQINVDIYLFPENVTFFSQIIIKQV